MTFHDQWSPCTCHLAQVIHLILPWLSPVLIIHCTVPYKVEGWINTGTAVKVHSSKGAQPMPKTVYHSGCCDKQKAMVGFNPAIDPIIAKLFLVQRLEKSFRGNYAYVWRYSNFVFVWFDKYLPPSGGLSPRPEALDQVEA